MPGWADTCDAICSASEIRRLKRAQSRALHEFFKLPVRDHLLDDIEPANKFAVHDELGERRPVVDNF